MGIIFVYWICGLVEFRTGGLEARRWNPDERRRISFAFLLCLMALPITPYGTRIAVSPFEFAFSLPLNMKYIKEWQSMPFSIPDGKIFLALVLGLFLAQVILRLTWRLEELALFLFGTMMACLHVRFLLLFVPFFAPLPSPRHSGPMDAGYERDKDKFALNAAANGLRRGRDDPLFPLSSRDLMKESPSSFPWLPWNICRAILSRDRRSTPMALVGISSGRVVPSARFSSMAAVMCTSGAVCFRTICTSRL